MTRTAPIARASVGPSRRAPRRWDHARPQPERESFEVCLVRLEEAIVRAERWCLRRERALADFDRRAADMVRRLRDAGVLEPSTRWERV